MGFLALLGIISTCLLLAGGIALLVLVAKRLWVIRRGARAGKESIIQQPVFFVDIDRQERKKSIKAFKARYDTVYEKLNIPENASRVIKCTDAFSLEHVPLEHYAWSENNALCFFPKWESIALCLLDPAYIHCYLQAETENLFGWRIPTEFFEYYRIDSEQGTATVHYGNGKGGRFETVLLEGGAQFLRTLFPERDYVGLERRNYLGSYENIQDFQAGFSVLSAKLEQGLISAEEYEREKKKLMRLL